MPVNVLGWTCRVRARSPAESPGKLPTIRSTRRCGPVMPNFACMPRDARSRPWLIAHISRMKSRTGPSGLSAATFAIDLLGRAWERLATSFTLLRSTNCITIDELCR